MSEFIPTIGLEIHAELKTRTKMFCNSKNDADEILPNVNVCPVCMGHPGTLPVINKEAVRHVLKVGVALGGTLADFTEFVRKNYFYPDIPKGYQISQYKYPLVSGGELNGIAITRVHLEEDTARSEHAITNHQSPITNWSLLDFNRAGVPLMELVTEPVIHDAKTASEFARELQLLLRHLKVSEANMEKGEMRVEANISISKNKRLNLKSEERFNLENLGTKVEVKNLNSFKSVERAIEYEVERQSALLERGELVAQETRGWDESKQETFSQRKKEESHDYRYFPDPDLPTLKISDMPEFSKETLKREIGELPDAKRERFKKNFGATEKEIEVFVESPEVGEYLEEVVRNNSKIIKLAINYILSDYLGLLKKENKQITAINAKDFSQLMMLVHEKKISSRGAKDILAEMFVRGGDPEKIALEKELFQQSNGEELNRVVKKIISENGNAVNEVKNGKTAALQFLVGQAMKATKGSANPELLRALFEAKIRL